MPRRFRRRFRRRSRRFIPTGPVNPGKRMVDGTATKWISTGVRAIPYLIKTVRMMKGLINSELHYLDTTETDNVSSSGDISGLTLMATGDTDVTREGNKILAHDVYVRGYAQIHTSALQSIVRIILFVDKECDGVAPTVANVLQTTSYLSPLNQNFSKRFVVLHDRSMALNDTGENSKPFKFYVKVPFHIHYDGTSANITDAKENQIFLLLISNESTNTPVVNWYARFKWYDN